MNSEIVLGEGNGVQMDVQSLTTTPVVITSGGTSQSFVLDPNKVYTIVSTLQYTNTSNTRLAAWYYKDKDLIETYKGGKSSGSDVALASDGITITVSNTNTSGISIIFYIFEIGLVVG